MNCVSHDWKQDFQYFLTDLFATAHTFCASRYGAINSNFLRKMHTNSKEFDFAGKELFNFIYPRVKHQDLK